MANSYIAEFEKVLLRHFPIYQSPRNGRGYRRLQFDGDVIEMVKDADHMVSLVKDALPGDVTISCLDGNTLRIHVSQYGAACDAYDIFLASVEWKGPEDGGAIPQIQVIFQNTYDSRGTIVTEIRDVTDLTLLQDRIEKLHIEKGDVIVVGSQGLATQLSQIECTDQKQLANKGTPIIVAPEGDITKLTRSQAVDALVSLIDERANSDAQPWIRRRASREAEGLRERLLRDCTHEDSNVDSGSDSGLL